MPRRSILKFRFERGKFSLFATKLGSNSQFVHSWDEWVNKVLKNPTYVKLLITTRILNVVRVTSKLNICKEKTMNVRHAILTRKKNANEKDVASHAPPHRTKHAHHKRETIVRVELNLVKEEETSEVETKEESCDSKCSDKSNDKPVDVDEVEIEDVVTSFRTLNILLGLFDDFVDLDALFPFHTQSSNINQVKTYYYATPIDVVSFFIETKIILTPQIAQDKVILDTDAILVVDIIFDIGVDVRSTLNVEVINVVLDVTVDVEGALNVEVIHDVKVNVGAISSIEVVHDVETSTNDVKATLINPHASSSKVPKHKGANSAFGTQVVHIE
ncbi:Uncharacterized protein TCM_039524 [Theobroma cacao]|uniref:Uncharacterized protein n=1 Tax=Theobroma cacao TaxID=3641 RepID=A0A061GRB7_THECC|nr:Uncharacterized protein TCM_039524 [Theobroma cacao]